MMLVAVASFFTACENPNTKLAQSLVGTWNGSNYFGGEAFDAEYQFFACDENNSGKFMEMNHLSFSDEVDGIEYELPYIAFVGGTYTVKDGNLIMIYDPETAGIHIQEGPVSDYVNAYLTYDREKGEGAWGEDSPESVIEYFIDSRTGSYEKDWTKMCEEYNANNSNLNGFSELKVDEKTMSYQTSDLGTLKYTRSSKDWFEKYPF